MFSFALIGLANVLHHLPAMSADGLEPPQWLTRYHWAKPSLMMMGLWAAIGSNNMLLYIAGISNVPTELYEAADIDGASRFQRFWHVKNLHHRVAAGLCKRGILRGDEDKILWLFRRRIYPEINPQPERKLIERLRKAIFGEGRRVDPRTVVILSLANGADLLQIHFDKRKLRGKKKRIAQVVNGDLMGKATKEAIEAAEAAVMVACIMLAIMVSTMSS